MRGFFYAGNFLAVLYPQMNADNHECFMLYAVSCNNITRNNLEKPHLCQNRCGYFCVLRVFCG
jgi:hypothetical protein